MALLSVAMSFPLRAGWKEEADERIEKFRKGDFTLRVFDSNGKPLANVAVQLHQTASDFHFGVAVAEHLIGAGTDDSRNYEKYVTGHFNTIVCENSMKWYSTEKTRDVFTYEVPDKVIRFAKDHGLAVRGHCLFWSRKKYVQPWVQQLNEEDLRAKVSGRIGSIVPRYKDQVISWDVNNEMLDGSFYSDRLGEDIQPFMFKKAHEMDPRALLFVNEYSILDNDEKLNRYIELIRSLQAKGAPVGGIGIQEHAAERFAITPGGLENQAERMNRAPLIPAEVWARLDKLAEFGLPIHLTEISARAANQQSRADALEALFRVGFAHPKVEAILLWGFWANAHWLGPDAALVDKDWHVLPAGERINKMLLEEWRTNTAGTTDAKGNISFRGFYGIYVADCVNDAGQKCRGTVSLSANAPHAELSVVP